MILYIVRQLVSGLIGLMLLAMFLRAILSWFTDPMNEGKFSSFLYMITEPVIIPMRALCAKMHWFENTPMDMPFMLTYFLLSFIDLGLSFL